MSDFLDMSSGEIPTAPKKAQPGKTEGKGSKNLLALGANEGDKKGKDEGSSKGGLSKKTSKIVCEEDSDDSARSTKKGKKRSTNKDSSKSLDKAKGVLSPPDFFICQIVHDGQVFTPRVGHCVVEDNGLIYIYGGEDVEQNASSSLIKFNPGKNNFQEMAVVGSNPGPRRGATLTVWRPESRTEPSLILFGGLDDVQNPTSETWEFDLKRYSWKEIKLKKSPEPRYSHAATFCERENALYIFGGKKADGTVLKDAHYFKGTTWHALGSAAEDEAPEGRCSHSASMCTLDNGSVIAIFGGDLSGHGKGDNALWIYDIADDTWNRVVDFAGEPPCPRWKHAAAFFDKRLWIIGGTYAGWFRTYVMSDLFVFDFLANCWFKCAVDPKELGCHTDIGSLTVLPSSRALFIFGGADQHGSPSSDVFRLAPVCTTISLSSLRQELVWTVSQVKEVRTQLDSSSQEVTLLNSNMTRIAKANDESDQKIKSLAGTIQQMESKLKDVTTAVEFLQGNVKKLEEALAHAEVNIRAFQFIEKKFSIMEITVQEALAKLEQKADISSLREVAAGIDPSLHGA